MRFTLRKPLSTIVLSLIGLVSFSQENAPVVDTIVLIKKKKLELNLDMASRYIWRGQSWGGDYFVVQPTLNYDITDKLTVGFWATTNFKKEYFYPDGETVTKGYQEIDFNVSYQINSFLTLQIWDYYWPSVAKVDGIDNRFFNYSFDGVKTVDATLLFDFSDYHFPLNAMLSTLIAGNDYRYDEEGEHPKQNYTTYFELGYTWEEVFRKITLAPVVGLVFNNQAQYYVAGDYDRPTFVNLGIKATRIFDLGKRVTMSLSLNYIHNAAKENTEVFGRNFLVAGITFKYQ
jgi:hypothetical protein